MSCLWPIQVYRIGFFVVVMGVPGVLKQGMDEQTRSEFEQTLNRLSLSLFTVLYCNVIVWRGENLAQAVYIVAHLYFAASLLLVFSVLIFKRTSTLRRIGGTLIDIIAITIGMTLSSYYTSLFWGGYLWVTIGNGYRYGMKYLAASVLVSAVSFIIVIVLSDYWQQNLPLAFGLFVWMLLIPVYVSLLIKRYRNAVEVAKEASTTKSRFLANMSHELRTPLNAIIGYTEILLEDAEVDNAQEQIKDLSKIKSSASHLLSLINELLDISKIEAGKMELYYEIVNVPRLIADVESALQPLIDKNSNELRVNVVDDVGDIAIDALKMRQVLFNLLSNSSKFTHDGEISLFVTMVIKGSGPWLKLVVKDTGIGMTQLQLGKLFQPFTQAEESTSRNYGGTGLGLALCKEFAEMMGGEIDAYSEPGRGSTFIVMLPVYKRVPTLPA